jgi:hypothetical protein
MLQKQEEFFVERLEANHNILNLEIEMIEGQVIKSNNKTSSSNTINHESQVSMNELQVKLLNHLIKQSKINGSMANSLN